MSGGCARVVVAWSSTPGVGDRVVVGGVVRELHVLGGVPGALVDVGHSVTPVWLPLAVLLVERAGEAR